MSANDPAFPTDHAWESNRGLTKREYFAAMAMQGLADTDSSTYQGVERISKLSVALADSLIKALEA